MPLKTIFKEYKIDIKIFTIDFDTLFIILYNFYFDSIFFIKDVFFIILLIPKIS